MKSVLRLSSLAALALLLQLPSFAEAKGQKKRVPPGGHVAVVVDERLSALRAAPDLKAKLLRRLGRGHLVSIRGGKATSDGLKFYRVAINRRTSGWLQSDAVVASWRAGDDGRLLRLIQRSEEFDLITRARTFLDTFPHSRLRPKVLAMYASAAEEVAERLSRDAQRRFTRDELPAGGAPEFSYYLNYNSLDRYNRAGVTFQFDPRTKRFSYDGTAWREILRRYPKSPEADEARQRLAALAGVKTK